MPVADYFDLLPLLLPRERKSLLVVGWHAALAGRLGPWETIRVLVDESARAGIELPPRSEAVPGGASLVESAGLDAATTLLACGVGPLGWRHELPAFDGESGVRALALAPRELATRWRRQLPGETWTLSGLPVFGSPWVWVPREGQGIDWDVFSPRGRIELPWIRFNRMLGATPLGAGGITLLSCAASAPLRQILESAAPDASGPGRFWYHTKKNALVILTPTDPPLIVKVPLTSDGIEAVRAHQRCAETFRASESESAMLDLLPRKTRLVRAAGFEAGVEEAFHGVSAYRYLPRRRSLHAIQEQAARLLADWQEASAKPEEQGPEEFERFWEAPLRPLAGALDDHELRTVYTDSVARLKRRVLGRVFPIVPVHGDFWINNLMWDPERGEISGVLDWDRGRPRGLPLLDLFQLLYQRTHYAYSLHSRRALGRTLGRGFPGREGRMIRTQANRLGLTEDQIEDLFWRYWLGEAASNAESFLRDGESERALRWLGRRVGR